jgi:hypothetical protein
MEESLLINAITNLLDFISQKVAVPAISGMRIFELGNEIDEKGKFCVSRDSFVSPSAYEARFRELVDLGLPWINISCYGFFDNFLIVGIEIPNSILKRSVRTSVNFSAPPLCVIQKNWNAREILSIKL